jgi:hypothetical protein
MDKAWKEAVEPKGPQLEPRLGSQGSAGPLVELVEDPSEDSMG